ncbi:sensor histidine kinase [Bacillus sp. FJAT-42376]|uniref:HAMP domain-containing sensor histidine kinase n=1 Tax=Bacillus sp. FJAT-42376 TaxID=2014076 RepID=UPI000F516308|nr:HAMP domain-containing sensor histidine kinase [Bacillus sp. FJAT-42376]AZB44250.1 sensor histidine kinase [Bacillus sp. FJAT-42376]
MRNKPLFIQIASLFTGLIVVMAVVFFLVIPSTLKTFFTNELFRTIEERQEQIILGARDNILEQSVNDQQTRTVKSVFIYENGNSEASRFQNKTIKFFRMQAKAQDESSKRYTLSVGKNEYLYVIKKGRDIITGREVILVSYLQDTYRNELIQTLLSRIFFIFALIIVGGIILSFIFSKWLVKPLNLITAHVNKISKRNLNESLLLDRKDEIGKLAASIDDMRDQLKKQDEFQQTMLQNVSHDLKTPIMVIRSYSEAMKDGIHPTGSPEGTADIIEKEALLLEKKIKDLLYLTKLDYISQLKLENKPVSINETAEDVIVRFSAANPAVRIRTDLEEATVSGSGEQIRVLLENLLENALKFAETTVELSVKTSQDSVYIRCFNDGDPLSETLLSKMFQPFVKGEKGNFGLGLAIIKRIADLHHASITVENENNGVAFHVHFPV